MDLDTNNDLFPEGTYRFRVVDVPEEGQTNGGYLFFKFSFAAEVDGDDQPYQERFMRWMMGPICRGLGFEEYKPGKFHFEPTECLGREVMATICHEKIEKGASAGKVVARMQDIKPVNSEMPQAHRAAMNAQAPVGPAGAVGADDIPF